MDGEWGTINYQYWDVRDATVICRMLGFQFALKAGRASYHFSFGIGSGPIWFGFLNCIGSERSIADCNIYTPNLHVYSLYYYHHYDAGVICSASKYIPIYIYCTHKNILITHKFPILIEKLQARLVGGSQSNEGRVEFFYNNAWGSVCSYSSHWDIREANVVCKMLGYTFATRAWGSGQFGEGSGTTSVYRPQCTGTEANIAECFNYGWGASCSSSQYHADVGVGCASMCG